jgi:hypothetical protein
MHPPPLQQACKPPHHTTVQYWLLYTTTNLCHHLHSVCCRSVVVVSKPRLLHGRLPRVEAVEPTSVVLRAGAALSARPRHSTCLPQALVHTCPAHTSWSEPSEGCCRRGGGGSLPGKPTSELNWGMPEAGCPKFCSVAGQCSDTLPPPWAAPWYPTLCPHALPTSAHCPTYQHVGGSGPKEAPWEGSAREGGQPPCHGHA